MQEEKRKASENIHAEGRCDRRGCCGQGGMDAVVTKLKEEEKLELLLSKNNETRFLAVWCTAST